MDPQKLSQLDPKLRDAYQRVMGTVIPEPQVPAQAQTPPLPLTTPSPIPAPQLTPQPKPTSMPITKPTPTVEEPAITPAEPHLAIDPQLQGSNFVQMNSEVAAAPAVAAIPASNFAMPAQAQTVAIKKKGNMLMPILFVIAALVFIVVYALFWTKIFNLKLPFLG